MLEYVSVCRYQAVLVQKYYKNPVSSYDPFSTGRNNSHGKNMAKLLTEPNSLNTPAVTAQTVTVAGVCVFARSAVWMLCQGRCWTWHGLLLSLINTHPRSINQTPILSVALCVSPAPEPLISTHSRVTNRSKILPSTRLLL